MDWNIHLKRTKRGKNATIAADDVIKERYFDAQEEVEIFIDDSQSSREESSTDNNHPEIVG